MHKKSRKKLLQRKAQEVVLRGSFRDKKMNEVVSRMTRADVLGLLDGPVEVCDVPDVEKGEVLADSRGRGSFQKGE